eukprot:11696024-Prorocentrum_lima.AAC.1
MAWLVHLFFCVDERKVFFWVPRNADKWLRMVPQVLAIAARGEVFHLKTLLETDRTGRRRRGWDTRKTGVGW